MIRCLALVFTVDRVEDEVVVLEVGAEVLDVAGLAGATEGGQYVLCALPPASPDRFVPASASATPPSPPVPPSAAPTGPAT